MQNPADPDLIFRQAAALQQQGRFGEAEALYRQLLAAAPGFAPAWNNRGNVLRRLGRFGEALESFDRALALQPDFADAAYNRANLLFVEMGRTEEAVAGYDQALAARPDFLQAWDNRGSALSALGKQQEALAAHDRATALDPAYYPAWNNRGNVLQKLGRFAEALESFDHALALKPDFANAQFNRGNLLFLDLKRGEEALAAYDAALALRPDFRAAWSSRGNVLSVLGWLAAALESYDRVLALGEDAEGWKNRGHVLFELDRLSEAMASFARAAQFPQATNFSETPLSKLRHDQEQEDYLASLSPRRQITGAPVRGPAVTRGNVIAAEQWRRTPQIAVIDDLLTPEALEGLRRFCREEKVWRAPYDGGYLGAFPEHGFACPLLEQVARELREAFPDIFHDLPLRYMWGFKYDSRLTGINIHADQAAVNVNFWLTPDEANLDPQSGGLVVWDVAAPLDWDFDAYNSDTQGIRDFLAKSGAKPVRIPYRANRAVIFDSDLFHETDTIRFQDGYLNRRINVTMLFGRRAKHVAT